MLRPGYHIRNKLTARVTLFALMFFCLNTYGGINLKNGNFYITYNDYTYCVPGKGCFEISRTYNSISADVTSFGTGWGCDFDTRLYFLPDGTVKLHYNGNGATHYYINVVPQPSVNGEMINKLAVAALKNNHISSDPLSVLKWKNDLYNSRSLRLGTWVSFEKKGWVQPVTPVPGIYEYDGAYVNTLVVKEDGYSELSTRCNCNEGQFKKLFFNPQGRIIKEYHSNDEVIDENDFHYNIAYNDSGRAEWVYFADDTIHVEYNGPFISHILGKGGEAFISINEQKDLVSAYEYNFDKGDKVVTDSFIYHHTYDAIHNMTSISYTDGTKLMVTYDGGMATSINERDTLLVLYSYKYFNTPEGTLDNDHYATSVTRISSRDTIRNYYEWQAKVGPSGESYEALFIRDENGDRYEAYYNEFEDVERVVRNGLATTFTYNSRRNLISAYGNKFIYNVTYNDKDMMLQAQQINCGTGDTILRVYTYRKGQLVTTTENGVPYKMKFDKAGKVIATEAAGETLKYEYVYGSMEFPSHVFFDDGRQLQLDYDFYGELSCKHGYNNERDDTNELFSVYEKHWKNTEPLYISRMGDE